MVLTCFSWSLVTSPPVVTGGMAAVSVKSEEERFQEWMKRFNKNYKSEEEKVARFESFKVNLRVVDAQLARGVTGFGLNLYADHTVDEFFTEILGRGPVPPSFTFSDTDSDSDHNEVVVKGEDEGEGKRADEFGDEVVHQRPLVPVKR